MHHHRLGNQPPNRSYHQPLIGASAMTYHATECIFDLIAACGPQALKECTHEVKTQATDELSIRNPEISVITALAYLCIADIIDLDGDTFDFTNYGFDLLAGISQRQRDYEAHRRTLD
jgi:hypothetical protein